MRAKQPRCDVSVIPEGDYTGENAIECGIIAVPCIDCNGSAGWVEQAYFRRHYERVCDGCKENHACRAEPGKTRAAYRPAIS